MEDEYSLEIISEDPSMEEIIDTLEDLFEEKEED